MAWSGNTSGFGLGPGLAGKGSSSLLLEALV